MSYKSEIRDSQIKDLIDKVSKRNYKKYLYKIEMHQLRGFVNQTITFDFPVTALIAPNGGGKTTILGAAYIAYNEGSELPPRRFFSRSGALDNSMQGWRITYEIIDRDRNRKDPIQRTAKYNAKWVRNDFFSRDKLLEFGISRTIPAIERPELKRYASKKFAVSGSINVLSPQVIADVERILGKETGGYSHIPIRQRGRSSSISGDTDSLLSGDTQDGTKYSEFNFGAGESSVIRMLMAIENADDHSLILIEEIENGLHPVATTRMVEHLIKVAEDKKMQIIFTTHSDEALLPLPPQAIWASINWKLVQGKLDIKSLRSITGKIDKKLIIYTEDEFDEIWLRAILRAYTPRVAIDAIEIFRMGGASIAVNMNTQHNQDPASKIPSVCFVDGDQPTLASAQDKVFLFPGQEPEEFILNQVYSVKDIFAAKLALALHQSTEDASRVIEVMATAKRSTIDAHNLFAKIGDDLGLIPKPTVEGAFTSIWTQAFPDEVAKLLEPIKDFLPYEGRN